MGLPRKLTEKGFVLDCMGGSRAERCQNDSHGYGLPLGRWGCRSQNGSCWSRMLGDVGGGAGAGTVVVGEHGCCPSAPRLPGAVWDLHEPKTTWSLTNNISFPEKAMYMPSSFHAGFKLDMCL